MRHDQNQGPSRVPMAGMPQQRQRQNSNTFGSSGGSGDGGGGSDNIYNFDDDEFQDGSFGSLRMGQKKSSSFSSSQSSTNSNANSKFGTPAGFGAQDSSDEDYPNASNNASGIPSQAIGSQTNHKPSSMISPQTSSSGFSGMPNADGREGSSTMGNPMRQQPPYSGANMGIRQQGPMMASRSDRHELNFS